jgi:hypothetical protein
VCTPGTTGPTLAGTITRPGLQPSLIAVYEGGNELLIADLTTKTLLVYDGATLNLVAEIAFPGDTINSAGMAIEETRGKAYLSSQKGVIVVDLKTNAVVTTIAGLQVDPRVGLTKDDGQHAVYGVEWSSFRFFAIDSTSDTLTRYGALPVIVSGMDVNPVTHEVFVTCLHSAVLTMFDPVAKTLVTLPGNRTFYRPIVDWKNNKVFASFNTFSGVWVLDRKDNGLRSLAAPTDGHPTLFGPLIGAVYGTGEVNRISAIVDGKTEVVTTLTEFTGMPLVAGPTTGNVYYVRSASDITVVTEPERKFATISVAVLAGAGAKQDPQAALNRTTSRLFIAADPGASRVVAVIDDRK